MKAFDIFYIMTGGGPNNRTELLGTYMYKQAFVHFNMGYGSAIAFMMFLFAFIAASMIQVMEAKRKKKGGGVMEATFKRIPLYVLALALLVFTGYPFFIHGYDIF